MVGLSLQNRKLSVGKNPLSSALIPKHVNFKDRHSCKVKNKSLDTYIVSNSIALINALSIFGLKCWDKNSAVWLVSPNLKGGSIREIFAPLYSAAM